MTSQQPSRNSAVFPRVPFLAKSTRRRLASTVAAGSLALFAVTAAFADKPPLMFGVNLSGPEAGNKYNIDETSKYSDGQLKRNYPRGRFGWDYNYPSRALYDYYRNRGITLIRLPLKWERIQHSLNEELDPTEMSRLDASIAHARAAGMQVLLDLHNYNSYALYTDGYWEGHPVNYSEDPTVTSAHFANFWDQMATHFVDEPAVFGYDLMNEPKGTVARWAASAQAAVHAIRLRDKKRWIVVEGVNWAGAQSWVSSNPDIDNSKLNIQDSAGRLIYSAHSYWDKTVNNPHKFDGIYGSYAAELGYLDMGIDCMRPFVSWVTSRGYNGLIGEYGVPWATDASSWSTVLDRSLWYLKNNGISGTYWAGGPMMGAAAYELSCQANSLSDPDLPSMTVLRKYGGILFETENTAYTATDTVNIVPEDLLSKGKGTNFLANAIGDQITYTLPNVPAGTYNVYVRCKKHASRGRFQLAIAGENGAGGFVNQGAVQDLYASVNDYVVIHLGAKTINSTGNKEFRFSVVGKNASSTGYGLLIDYIQLQK